MPVVSDRLLVALEDCLAHAKAFGEVQAAERLQEVLSKLDARSKIPEPAICQLMLS